MAIKKNTSAYSASKTASPLDLKIKKLDDRMSKLRELFGWGLSDAQTDLSRACYGEITGQLEGLDETAMAALGKAPMYELMVSAHQGDAGDFQLLRLCAQMYLAGKISPARINMAVFDAANPPLIPDKL